MRRSIVVTALLFALSALLSGCLMGVDFVETGGYRDEQQGDNDKGKWPGEAPIPGRAEPAGTKQSGSHGG